jgi:hypothetical protein
MKHIHTLIAVPALACGVVLIGASHASAQEPPPDGSIGPGIVVVHERGPAVQVDDTVAEVLQAGAAALGGAGITMAALWTYRRRHPLSVH